VPGGDASTEGDSNNGFPFNLAEFSLTSQIYQQVYSSTAFGSGPILITGMDFRPDGNSDDAAAFAATLSDISIDLSTTTAAVNGLSATFANNIGTDDTTVLPAGPLSLSSSDTGPAGGPKNFDIDITFATPFLYDPSKGNLLLEVLNFGGGSTTQFDADLASTVMSRVYSTTGGVSSTTGSTDSSGLVTQFVFGPATSTVPEPALPAVCGIGLAAIAFARRFARKSS